MPESTITLARPSIAPLREALYSCLTNRVDALNAALSRPQREQSDLALSAYGEVAALAAMLDRIGWQHSERDVPLTIDSTAHAQLIIEALSVELQVEEDLALSRYETGELAEPESSRARTLEALLSSVAAAGADTGLTAAEATNDA